MEGLRTARVLVIDDRFAEVESFVRALGSCGIGCVYLSGNAEEFPKSPLINIRLVAADLDLGTSGGETHQVVGPAVSALERAISERNGPYLLVAWTNRDELFEEFERQVLAFAAYRRPVRIIKIGKEEVNGDLGALVLRLEESLSSCYPLSVLWWWEQLCSDSSGQVLTVVSEQGGSQQWMQESLETLLLLRNASPGGRETLASGLRGLLDGFGALHQDALETVAASRISEDAERLLSGLGTEGDMAGGRIAIVNSRLLFSEPSFDVVPGTIYASDTVEFDAFGEFPTLSDLLSEMAQNGKHQELEESCVLVAMEVTPLCDYRPQGAGFCRFLCGVVVPFEKRTLIKQAGFLQSTPDRRSSSISWELKGDSSDCAIVWNSHYIISVPRSRILPNAGAGSRRLRHSPLVDVQAWLGSQANRPGYLVV